MISVNDTLLSDVKNYLDITWEDVESDKKLAGIIKRGISVINDRCGAEFDYSKDEMPKELLINYVMYARANAVDEFLQHYATELLRLQLITEVEGYEKAK